MEFHLLKCSQITFTKKYNILRKNAYSLHFTQISWNHSGHQDQLGLQTKPPEENSSCGVIRRNINIGYLPSLEMKSLAYKQVVRPVLEYAAGAWDSLVETSWSSKRPKAKLQPLMATAEDIFVEYHSGSTTSIIHQTKNTSPHQNTRSNT